MSWWRVKRECVLYREGIDPDDGHVNLPPGTLLQVLDGPRYQVFKANAWSADGSARLYTGDVSIFFFENPKVLSPLTPLEVLARELP